MRARDEELAGDLGVTGERGMRGTGMTSGATASAARRGRGRRASGKRLRPEGREEADMRASLVSREDDARASAGLGCGPAGAGLGRGERCWAGNGKREGGPRALEKEGAGRAERRGKGRGPSWAEARFGLGWVDFGSLGWFVFSPFSFSFFYFPTTLKLFEFKFKFEFNPNTQPK